MIGVPSSLKWRCSKGSKYSLVSSAMAEVMAMAETTSGRRNCFMQGRYCEGNGVVKIKCDKVAVVVLLRFRRRRVL